MKTRYSHESYELGTLDRHLSLWDDEPEIEKPQPRIFTKRGRKVYRDDMNVLRDAKTNRFVKEVD